MKLLNTFSLSAHNQKKKKKHTKAPQAAGVIHTDFEKTFVMAEVMAFDDFKEYGSEAECKVSWIGIHDCKKVFFSFLFQIQDQKIWYFSNSFALHLLIFQIGCW